LYPARSVESSAMFESYQMLIPFSLLFLFFSPRRRFYPPGRSPYEAESNRIPKYHFGQNRRSFSSAID
ncbi:MAG: hypothetical protein KJO34_17225, partial [Deltaproteobacteria bacterium]|nr:hypothetical protein [Deltaproteobacteria bacterium]